MRLLTLGHLVVNALLLCLGYYWLGVGETRAATLTWSAFLALVLVCLGSWIYGASFAYFQSDNRRASAAWRTACRNLWPLAVAVIAVTTIYFLLAWWAGYSAKPASTFASFLTLKLRKPVKPSSVLRVFNVALWLIRWVILPVLLLPMLSAVAGSGWRGFRSVGTLARKWIYWIEAPLLLLCAFWVPLKILGWIPEVGGFGMEVASLAVRAAVAYLLFIAGWLALAFVTSAGKPRLTQSNTAASP